jgi:hypothetical protein
MVNLWIWKRTENDDYEHFFHSQGQRKSGNMHKLSGADNVRYLSQGQLKNRREFLKMFFVN